MSTIASAPVGVKPAAVQALAQEAEGHAGRIDILINNAGTIRRHPATDFRSVEEWWRYPDAFGEWLATPIRITIEPGTVAGGAAR